MFITPQDDNKAAQQAVAMQEIEVVSMDDGEENITLSTSTLRSTTPSTLIELSPPPLLPCLSSSPLSTSSAHQTPAMPPQSIKEQQQDESLDILLSMLSKEQTLSTIDYTTRINVKPTPISISASSSDNRSLSSNNLLDSPNTNNSNNTSSTEEEEPINNSDRTKMCDWYYEMSDFLKISRSTASRSLTLLDRFMSTDVSRLVSSSVSKGREEYNVAGVVVAATQNRDEYQLVALTALFLSIKLYERLNIQPEHVSYLSRGRYTSDEVIKMEIVMLQALEWKVCVADKIDYVESYLDVLLPSMKQRLSSCLLVEDQDDTSSSSTNTDNVLSSLKELATLQIQLSDFDPSYSTQRPSLVAFAAVINAFELKKDKLSNVDQSTFLTSVHVLMDKMYPLNDFLSKDRHTRERQELGSTVDRLRILVDPPSAVTAVGNMCGVMDTTTTPVELTPTSYQQQYQDDSDDCGSSSSCNDDNSTSLHDRQVSPLDMALESMENFDMAQLLCCGMPHRHHASASSYQAAAADAHAMYNNKNVMDMMDTDDEEEDDEDEDEDPAAVMSAASHQHLLESATSFGSIPTADRQQHSIKVTNSVSPTSIAILFGGGAASSNKK